MFRTSEAKKNEKIRRSLVVMEQPEQVPSVAEQLALLRQELGQMRRSMEDAGIVRKSREAEKDNELRVSFARDGEGRKPFSCSIKLGARSLNVRLSSIRYAILFSLFLDLHKRRHTGAGLEDIRATIRHCYEILEGEHCPLESLRVGLYQALRQFEASLGQLGIKLFRNIPRLGIEGHSPPEHMGCEVHLSVEEPLLAPILNSLSGTSMLARVRSAKALVLPPGPESIDRVLLELYRSQEPLRISSLYFRPAFIGYPQRLLENMSASQALLERRELHDKRIVEGRLEVEDFIPLDSLWEQIRVNERKEFVRYAKGSTKADVVSHFEHILWLLDSGRYSLVLTTVEAPFFFVKYELIGNGQREAFVLFPKREQGVLNDFSGLLIHDESVCRDMERLVLDSMKNHPGTIKDRRAVRTAVEAVRDHLLNHGPLSPGQYQHPI